jgi:Ca2+-transporting ATPase
MIEQKPSQPWHALDLPRVYQELETDPHQGLASRTAQERLAKFGPNQLSEGKTTTPLEMFIEQFKDFIVLTLIAAAVISGFLGEWVDATAIIAIVILNAILGVVQEYRAEKALAALKKLAAPTAQVIRDGETKTIPSIELVPGDLIALRSGDLVPADARLIDAHMLQVEEAMLTGESSAAEKTASEIVAPEAGIVDRVNMVFAGTVVARGRGHAIVTATGMDTQLGKIAGMVAAIEKEETPLQKRLDQVGKQLVYASLAVVGIVFIVGVLRGDDPVKMFLVAVSLAVAAVPEGLAAVVTIALALGMRRMVQRNALIRKLPAVETLGAATFICTDKTGTLTENAMTVREYVFADRIVTVTGEGFSSAGKFYQNGQPIDPANDRALRLALTIGARCNTSEIQPIRDGSDYRVIGDPTEGALLIAAEKAGLLESIELEYDFVAELPFDSVRKRMTVICTGKAGEHRGKQIAFVKGALGSVINLCRYVDRNGTLEELDDATRERIRTINNELANQTRRLLALAYRPYDETTAPSIETVERDLIFVALVGMIDPPRAEARQAVAEAQSAGIQVALITGDHVGTALAVAREVGIVPPNANGALTGAELERMSDEELKARALKTYVYARVSPEHKLRIVQALKANNQIVAMTGDGVNDAPALKEASIGVAMGVTGTDVAKEAADMVLLDDNFASIVAAIREGRAIFDNIRKFIHFVLSHNIGEVLAMFFATVIGWPLPLLPIQILWINLVTDSLPALALGVEKAEPGIMERPPRSVDERILPNSLLRLMFFQGSIVGISTLAAFAIEYFLGSGNLARAQAEAFAASILAQNVQAFNVRSNRLSIFQLGPFSNPYLVGAFTLVVVTLLGLIYIPPLQEIFKTVPLGLNDWLVISALALLPLVVMEIYKFVLRAREKK